MRSLVSVGATVLAVAGLIFGAVLPAAAGEGCGGYSTRSVGVPTTGQSFADGSTATVSKPGKGG